jgi:hypothetical protein
MQNYNNLIYDALKGETPKEKYEYLRNMQQLLHEIAFPGRGTDSEQWQIMDVVEKINDKQLVDWNGEYKY